MSPRPLGATTITVLNAVHRGHRYGADVMEATGLGGGTVYKILRRLERRESVRGMWEDPEVAERERRPRRRYYRVTADGEVELAAARKRFGALAADLAREPDRTSPDPGHGSDPLPEPG